MNDGQFLNLVDEIWNKGSDLNSRTIAVKVNKLLLKMDVSSIDEDALEAKVKELPESAKEALLQALKDEKVGAILSIIGMKPSMKKGII